MRRLRTPAFLSLLPLLVILTADQLTKAAAWRHRTDVHMNAGGDLIARSMISGWFRDPVIGAALDCVDFALLLTAWLLVAGLRMNRTVRLPAAVVLAGWTSNLFDRLGLHYLTAPGSVRGVVDWIRWDGRCWNVADIAIVAGSAGLAASVVVAAARSVGRRRARRPGGDRAARRPAITGRTVLGATAGVATAAMCAAVGAIAYAGVTEPVQLLASGH
jgi:lipoprotein signal peptidase